MLPHCTQRASCPAVLSPFLWRQLVALTERRAEALLDPRRALSVGLLSSKDDGQRPKACFPCVEGTWKAQLIVSLFKSIACGNLFKLGNAFGRCTWQANSFAVQRELGGTTGTWRYDHWYRSRVGVVEKGLKGP